MAVKLAYVCVYKFLFMHACMCVSVTVSVYVRVCVIYSAADEYILRYFDKVMKDARINTKLLRVCDPDRNVRTVIATVQKYCLMSQNKQHFVLPTRADIKQHDIVVTTLVTSLALHQLNVNGLFTHIFVDEAAQVSMNSSYSITQYDSETYQELDHTRGKHLQARQFL